ncbi:MAG: hypothetical protein R3F19_21475 [Verrucomicrobiales bacterium]
MAEVFSEALADDSGIHLSDVTWDAVFKSKRCKLTDDSWRWRISDQWRMRLFEALGERGLTQAFLHELAHEPAAGMDMTLRMLARGARSPEATADLRTTIWKKSFLGCCRRAGLQVGRNFCCDPAEQGPDLAGD